MPQDHLIFNGGESPLAHQLESGATTAAQHLDSTTTQSDGGAAPISGKPHASPTSASTDPSGIAGVGGIVRAGS